jgi:hypothetical protein
MILKCFIGLGIVVIIGQNDPNLKDLAMGCYLLSLSVDFVIFCYRGMLKS